MPIINKLMPIVKCPISVCCVVHPKKNGKTYVRTSSIQSTRIVFQGQYLCSYQRISDQSHDSNMATKTNIIKPCQAE